MSMRGSRPAALQAFISAAGNLFLADDVPTMARYIAGKVFHDISRASSHYCSGGIELPAVSHLSLAVGRAREQGGKIAAVAAAMEAIVPGLRWYQSNTGPFASVNFLDGHAHAYIVGPDGLEQRDCIHLGVTILAPFTRYPDHRRRYPAAFAALSHMEVRVDESAWMPHRAGGVFFAEGGSGLALRCTSGPALVLWCERASGR
ncbi:putative transcriptional regulator protein [Sinorhizobium fredii NGR234]|uniref:Transcriptional regulator protein n=2 Tax=Rhizobium fredii TaxID=380 RepID=C3MED9_SINFN|nr:putative transcriptional regulator protein [Sinorhizobium fredii NGR234]